MKFAKTSGALSLALLATFAAQFAMADDTDWYIGGNVGQSKSTIDDTRINDGLMNGGFTSSSISDRNHSTGYELFGGYQFNNNFAIEGGYFDLGKFGYTANTVPAGTLNGDIKLQGLNLDLVGILPLTEKFSLYGRAGVIRSQARDNFTGTGAVSVTNPDPSKNDTNYKIGLGMQYAITDSLDARAGVERYRINDAVGNRGDIDLISVGLVYRFGSVKKTAPAPAYVAPAPVYVAPAPAPAPVVAPPVVKPPEPKKVSFSADSLFDFDQSAIKPQGAQALDKFASDLRGTDYSQIKVTGHTDRIGSHAYNMKLSTRRADAVKDYLVQSAGIPSDKITAQGVGDSEPVTKPGDCKGKKVNAELKACLQPDRQVEVEVSGTK